MALVGDDCFFFLNAGCVRGSTCTFRHQPAARNTAIICPEWVQQRCFKPNCALRHTNDPVSRDTREQTRCFFEQNYGFCTKPGCAFAHMKSIMKATPNGPVPVQAHPVMVPRLPISVPPTAASVVHSHPVLIREPQTVVVVVEKDAIPPPLPPPLPAHLPNAKMAPLFVGNGPGMQLITGVKEVIHVKPPQQPQAAAAAGRTASPHVLSVPPTKNVSVLGAIPAVFPKNEHFNEQVRRFKEMLAAKETGRKEKDDAHSEDEGRRSKERQRNKKDRREREREAYKAHKSNKSSSSKDVWRKGDEEILYGDYKDVPLDKKSTSSKRKKHGSGSGNNSSKEFKEKEHADSEPEIKVKSYEEILREKALRKLYSKRKEKFNEDFQELVRDQLNAKKEGVGNDVVIPSVKVEVAAAVDVLHKHKKYNSDGDEVISDDSAQPPIEKYVKRRRSKSDDSETTSQDKSKERYEDKRVSRKKEKREEGMIMNDDQQRKVVGDIHDNYLRAAILNSEKRQSERQSKKHKKSKKKKRRERKEVEEQVNEQDSSIEVITSSDSQKEDGVIIVIKKEDDVVIKKEVVIISKEGEEEPTVKVSSSQGADTVKVNSSQEADTVKVNSSQDTSLDTSIVDSSNNEDSDDADSDTDSSEELPREVPPRERREQVESRRKPGADVPRSRTEEIVIPDETTSIDFDVDCEDDLAKEISANGRDPHTKSKKISSVVSVINRPSSDRNRKQADKEASRKGYSTDSSRRGLSSDNNIAKVPPASTDNNSRQTQQSSPSQNRRRHKRSAEREASDLNEANSKNNTTDGTTTDSSNNKSSKRNKSDKPPSSPVLTNSDSVKVKTFDEIMAEKHQRSRKVCDVATSDGSGDNNSTNPGAAAASSKTLNATLKEKSTQAKMEILSVSKTVSNNMVSSTGWDSKVVPVPVPVPVPAIVMSSRSKSLTDEEKLLKRKSLQLYKPPHPGTPHPGDAAVGATTEVKMVVNTGPRKIIRIRKASLSTDLIDSPNGSSSAPITDTTVDKEGVHVRSFEEIIREKRARQKKEQTLANQLEKENSKDTGSTGYANNLIKRKPILRRPPVVSTVAMVSTAMVTMTCSSSKMGSSVSSLFCTSDTVDNVQKSQLATDTATDCSKPTNTTQSITHTKVSQSMNTVPPNVTKPPYRSNTDSATSIISNNVAKLPHASITELINVINHQIDQSSSASSNVAKGSHCSTTIMASTPPTIAKQLKVSPQKRSSRVEQAPVVALQPTVVIKQEEEELENRDFYSRLRNSNSSRRTSLRSSSSSSDHPPKDNTNMKTNSPVTKLRKRSVTEVTKRSVTSTDEVTKRNVTSTDEVTKRNVASTGEVAPVAINRTTTQRIPPYSFEAITAAASDKTSEDKVEGNGGASRKDIQEALDEEKRKREEDLLSDDEFEKEINELCSDDDGELDDINEDDLMMELEQMIDS